MSKLPESKNPNLPRPVAAAAPMRPIPGPPPPPESRPPLARAVIGLLLVGGLFAAGIFAYIKGVQRDVVVEESLNSRLVLIGKDIWNATYAQPLLPLDDEASKDLDDLGRIVAMVKDRIKREGSREDIYIHEGDPPPGKGTATHQIRFLSNGDPYFIIRVRVEAKSGLVYFLGEANRVTPSRKEWEKGVREVPKKDALPPLPERPKVLPKSTKPGNPATPLPADPAAPAPLTPPPPLPLPAAPPVPEPVPAETPPASAPPSVPQ